MSATPEDVKAAFQDAIPYRRHEFKESVHELFRIHGDDFSTTYPVEVLREAERELRSRIARAAERVKELIDSGWVETEMVNVSKVFLDCFGTFNGMDRDPQSDLYNAVEIAYEKVGQDNPVQATTNHRRLSEVQVQSATEALSDLKLYYAARHPSAKGEVHLNTVTLSDRKAISEAAAPWEYDAFVSYASDDQAYATELASRLSSEGVRIWIAGSILTLGDGLHDKISEGLKTSKYGIIILSKGFFEREWPRLELDGLVSIQTNEQRKVILPVWHDVTLEQVQQFSPILAGRLGVKTSEGFDKVVSEIIFAISQQRKFTQHQEK